MSDVASSSYELSVSYDREEGEDSPIFRIADQFGFTHVASGFGGCRDLHFERNDKTPTESEIEQIKAELLKLGFPVDANIEAWRYDAAGEAIEDDEENQSWSILTEL